jgi:putative ABC transport system permease protein
MLSLLRENIKIALESIKNHLLRTILTVLIIAIGIMALVGILSSVNALENTITGNFASMGANTFNIQRYEFALRTRGSGEVEKINPVIGYREVKEFKDSYNFPSTQTAISFTGTSTAEIRYRDKETDPEANVLGVNEHFLGNSGLELETGRGFTYFDIQNNSKVCILGADFKEALFNNLDPVNKTISIRGNKFKVIGLLESEGSTFQQNQDLRVLIPIQSARSIYSQPNINYNISVKVDDKNMMEAAQDEAIMTFRNIRGLSPIEENNFGILRSDSLLNQLAQLSSILNIAAWVISLITILGSSIALMNIMLVSVTERTSEIGIRKALGARKRTIANQFFMETILIGQFGGFLGILLGVLVGLLVASIGNLDFAVPWAAMFWAIFISFIIAMVSGGYPAVKAARQDPIESLRYE